MAIRLGEDVAVTDSYMNGNLQCDTDVKSKYILTRSLKLNDL